MKSLEQEIAKLRRWEDAYYNGAPVVPDATYDAERDSIVERIKKEAPDHPYLDEVGSPVPTGTVWAKFTHPEVMGSLFKVNSEDEFIKWAAKKGDKFLLAEKADGCTIVAYYEQGKLVTLATRGDGVTGEDITTNARYFENVRLKLPITFSGTLRGEGIIYSDRFEQHFAPLGMANPRNAASGKARDTKNPELKRYITVKWFDVLTNDRTFATWEEKFSFIETLGLEPIPYRKELSPKEVWKVYEEYVKHNRKKLNYWIDGLVCRISDMATHESFGVTDKRPKGSIAIKFPNTGVETILIGYELSRGLSGRIAPVGLVDPVLIDGTTVGRVSLHGPDWIKQMDIAVGDRVEVAKAGDIIPQIVRKVEEGKNRKLITFPVDCPLCATKLVRNGAYVECQNKSCDGETYGALAKWLEKLEIKGIGDSILQALVEDVKDVADLYEANVSVFIKATGGSDKTGKKIYKAVQDTRSLPLAVFLSGLHIDSLGTTNGQRIANHFKDLEKVIQASEDDLKKIDGIDNNASKIHQGLQRKKKLIQRLSKILDIEDVTEGALSGLSFCITGKLPSGKKRTEVEAWIKQHGGVVKGVDKDLTYLITDDPTSGSSKNEKADKYGIKKIVEEDLYKLVTDCVAKPRQIPTAAQLFSAKASAMAAAAVTKKIAVRQKQLVTSLFDDVFGGGRGWIEIRSSKAGKFEIVADSIREDGDSKTSKTRLGFAEWDGGVKNLDDGISEQAQKLKISSHLKCGDAEIQETTIRAANFAEAEDLVKKIIFTSWSEGDIQ